MMQEHVLPPSHRNILEISLGAGSLPSLSPAAINLDLVHILINKLESGQVFYIRDALPNTPSLFGRWAYEQRADLGIELVGKDRNW
jgi:hypothetical protein